MSDLLAQAQQAVPQFQSDLKDWSIIAAGIVALITLWTGLIQYFRQARQARANQFIQMRRRFLEDPAFREILSMVGSGDPAVAQTSIQDRRNLVGFLEEVGLMTNSGLIRPSIAHYMFGYYVGLIDESDAFWEGLDRDSEYWQVFREFAAKMKSLQGQPTDPSGLRL